MCIKLCSIISSSSSQVVTGILPKEYSMICWHRGCALLVFLLLKQRIWTLWVNQSLHISSFNMDYHRWNYFIVFTVALPLIAQQLQKECAFRRCISFRCMDYWDTSTSCFIIIHQTNTEPNQLGSFKHSVSQLDIKKTAVW